MVSVHFYSKTDNWSTPQNLFDRLNGIYGFDLDVCASKENAKFWRYYSKDDDAFAHDWYGRIWMNPPYGRGIYRWVKRAYESASNPDTFVVALLPARTDTKWFHEYIYNKKSVSVEFIRGRLKFGGSPNNAPFPSMIVVFGNRK